MIEIVESCKKSAVSEMEHFLKVFAHVPDDRLHWSPTPTSKSPIRVAAHTALYAGRFAQMIENRKLPGGEDIDAWVAKNEAEEIALTDRQLVIDTFRRGTERVLAALDALSEEDVAMRLDSGQGWSTPMRHLMSLPGWHAILHAGQIDYLQTCWDDQEVHLS